MNGLQITIHAKNVNIQQAIKNPTSTIEPEERPETEREEEKEREENQQGNSSIVDWNDVSAYSPSFMTVNKRTFDFKKGRWSEVIREIIKVCGITRREFIEKIPVIKQNSLPKYDVCAVYGRYIDEIFVIPERNGWFYILEFDISIRIKTSNKMFEMVKKLVKGTKHEGNICLFIHHDYDNHNRYRTIPL